MDAMPVAMFIARDPECRNLIGNRRTYELLRLPPGINIAESLPRGEQPANRKIFKDGKEIPARELPSSRLPRPGRRSATMSWSCGSKMESSHYILAMPFRSWMRAAAPGARLAYSSISPSSSRPKSVCASAEAGKHRPARRRHRSRFQQPPDGDHGSAESALNQYPSCQEIRHILTASERART